MRDIEPLIQKIRETVASHRLGVEGSYTRWLYTLPEGEKPAVNEYGCADAANILYSIGDFSPSPLFRNGFVDALKSLQHQDTGLFMEPTHFNIHTTAHCTASLELFDEKPAPPKALLKYLDKEKLYDFLENNIRWVESPWNNSHLGAGLYVSLMLSGAADRGWENAYFDWFYQEADPVTGLWRKDCVLASGAALVFEHMAGSFHYLFNHEYAARPLRYPEKMIDTCLQLYHDRALPDYFGIRCGFIEMDWIYCLTRASRQTPYKYYEVKEALRDFAGKYIDYLMEEDPKRNHYFDDLHMLFGSVCALAELYRALPGEFSAAKPLKLVLDRRPFI